MECPCVAPLCYVSATDFSTGRIQNQGTDFIGNDYIMLSSLLFRFSVPWGKSQFKKGSDWWKWSIWNRVMRSQPIRIQLGKILQENLAGQGGREKANLRKAVIGGNLAF